MRKYILSVMLVLSVAGCASESDSDETDAMPPALSSASPRRCLQALPNGQSICDVQQTQKK